jgi:hypothetical protein
VNQGRGYSVGVSQQIEAHTNHSKLILDLNKMLGEERVELDERE